MIDDYPRRGLIDKAEDLILRIRDIQSCRITTDEAGGIAEVHVVAATNRPPKMIARDVETCLKAELGLPIDYRKIGVVLIDAPEESETGIGEESEAVPGTGTFTGRGDDSRTGDSMVEKKLSETRPHKESRPTEEYGELEFLEEDSRIRFKGLSLAIDENRIDVEVKLGKGALEVIGCLGAFRKSGPVYETIAGAAIHAVAELLDENFHLCLSGIEEVGVSGHKALIVVIDMIEGRTVRNFSGSAFVDRDPNEAAVLAVLNAINRPFGRWKSRKEIHYRIS
ncbi:MAG: hypothetical protein JXB45_08555 [Candidatus Krumholzibacteriota bacterium]|nr:hypothetical protein [Candidatus Krumholzibacteriota bacterium]